MVKLYLITRKDLKPGQQMAQITHAMAEFARHNPAAFNDWYDMSMYVCCLSVEDEDSLITLSNSLKHKGIEVFEFREPDLCNQLTAISVNPQYYEDTRKMVSQIPLALKE